MTLQSLLASIAFGAGFIAEFKRSCTSNLDRVIYALANTTNGVVLPKLMYEELSE